LSEDYHYLFRSSDGYSIYPFSLNDCNILKYLKEGRDAIVHIIFWRFDICSTKDIGKVN